MCSFGAVLIAFTSTVFTILDDTITSSGVSRTPITTNVA